MSRFLKQTSALVGRDLRIELRSLEVLLSATLFAIVLITLFVFSGFAEARIAETAAGGVLWVSIAFVGTVIFGRTIQRDRESGILDALVLVPGVVNALFVSRIATNLILLVAIEVLLLPASLLVFAPDALAHLPLLLIPVLLGTTGFCVLGTVLAASLSASSIRDVLLPIVLFPLCIPLMIAGVQTTRHVLASGTLQGAVDWLAMMAAFNVTFAVLGRWLFAESIDHR